MKRSLIVLLVLLLSAGLLVAGGRAQSDEVIEIEYLTRMRAEEWGRDVFNKAAAEFERQNPGVRIRFTDISYDDIRSQMLLRAQAGNAPSMSEPVLAWIPQLAEAGILEPITNYLTPEDLAKYVQSPIDDATIDGVAYGVPLWHGPILLFGNVELMERAGIPIRGPETIHEFREWIERIGSLGTDASGQDIVGFSMRNNRSGNSGFWFVPWIWAFGGELVDAQGNPSLDTQEFRDALEFYQWATANGYSPQGIDAQTSRIIFAQGRAGFVFDGSWLQGMLRGMTDNPNIDNMYQPFMVPKGVTGEPWTIANPTSLVVLKGSQHKDVAFEFIKYLTSSTDVAGLLIEQMAMMPTYRPFAESDQRMQSAYVQEFVKQMPYSRGIPWKDPRWPGLEEILATALTQAIAGENLDVVARRAQQDFLALVR